MAVKTQNPFAPNTGLGAIMSERDLAVIMHAGRASVAANRLHTIIDELGEIWKRAQTDETLEGDTFRALRLLSGFPKRELILLLMELALPRDEEAIIRWRMQLKRRKPSRLEREITETTKRIQAKQKKREREEEVVRRVMLWRRNRGSNLDYAILAVAAGDDMDGGALLGQYIKKRVRTYDAVRRDYMAGMKWLKPVGSVRYRTGGLFGARHQTLYFGNLVKKGRRPGKK